MTTLTERFTELLNTISYTRAGWDFELTREERDKEIRQEKAALAEARSIWQGNPDQRENLDAAFRAAKPLATIEELERPSNV